MRVIVFGATGKTGQHVWRNALDAGHEVTCFARSVHKIEKAADSLRVTPGDITDADAVAAAVAEHEAAVMVVGSNGLGDKSTLSAGTSNVVEGMLRHDVPRLVVLSAAGVAESWAQIPWVSRLLFKTLLRNLYADHQRQEEVVMDSSLDWTIARAGILSDDPAKGRVIARNSGKAGGISRADLAQFLVAQMSDDTYSRQAISVWS